jgi:hypothetical protein
MILTTQSGQQEVTDVHATTSAQLWLVVEHEWTGL